MSDGNSIFSTEFVRAEKYKNIDLDRSIFYVVVIPAGVEPAIFWMRTRRPRPLDDGTNSCYSSIFYS